MGTETLMTLSLFKDKLNLHSFNRYSMKINLNHPTEWTVNMVKGLRDLPDCIIKSVKGNTVDLSYELNPKPIIPLNKLCL